MPFKSDNQKSWMYANKPDMAEKWSRKEKDQQIKNARRDAMKRKMSSY